MQRGGQGDEEGCRGKGKKEKKFSIITGAIKYPGS